MTVEPLLEKFVLMFDSFFHSEKSPAIPLFLKGDVFLRGLFPLFEKEGLGEIFDCGNRERTKP
ncbi:MAG TPA: hypothetical protein VFQ03_00345 [Candidatus Binatia bacterium]|nr:hypothetical protein [Candidatus Binatia bacterium]